MMYRFLTICFGILALLGFVPAHAEGENQPSCEALHEYRHLCERMREAHRIAMDVPLRIFETWAGKKKVLQREFALVAYDVGRDEFHTIVLAMPILVRPDFQPVVLTLRDPPYRVERLKGTSYNKMTFTVWAGDTELFVLAGKHLSVYLNGDRSLAALKATMRPLVYLSAPPYLLNEEFAEAGRVFVRTKLIQSAFDRLRELNVPSRAFPGRGAAEVISPDNALSIILAEHADRCLLPERDPGCARLIPRPIFATYDEVLRSVYLEFMVNGDRAYRYIVSESEARGIAQFTNRKKSGRLGTYDAVRKLYPQAKLDPDFVRGTEDPTNSIMALVCLLDLELAAKKLPPWVREASFEDRRVGSLVSGAAYNGGASQARRLSKLLDHFRERRGIETFRFDVFPWEEFLEWAKTRPGRLHPQTHGYVGKMVANWRHLIDPSWGNNGSP